MTTEETGRIKAALDRITVGHPIMNGEAEALFVWPDAETAREVVNESPHGDGSFTTWHRHATRKEAGYFRYDQDGNLVELAD